ncbi:hypothetical protein D3C71_2111680 [compost metagenome]
MDGNRHDLEFWSCNQHHRKCLLASKVQGEISQKLGMSRKTETRLVKDRLGNRVGDNGRRSAIEAKLHSRLNAFDCC